MARIAIVGATSTIAEHCARIWSAENELILIGRDEAALKRISKDLKVRTKGCVVSVAEVDFSKPKHIQNLVADVTAKKPIDIVLIAQGVMPEQEAAQKNMSLVRNAVDVNASSVIYFAETFAGAMEAAGHGSIAIIGSVAGDRGRRTNYIYGATKGFVATYANGLAHRFVGTDIHVTLIKPGPTNTAMTAELASQGRSLAEPDRVARDIVHGIAAHKAVVYTPALWRFVMLVIRHLPRSIFNRLNV